MTPEPEPQWPPRSPHEALVSTPGGRQRYQRIANEASPSSRRERGASARDLTSRSRRGTALDYNDDDENDDDDDDDDEETLQLKLEAIKARLRLKKLQNAKSKDKNPGQKSTRETSRQSTRTNDTAKPDAAHGTAGVNIEVPASPVRPAKDAQQQQQSPSRVLLGIDKGLKAKDISLKRAPPQAGARGGKSSFSAAPSSSSDAPRIQSFSERLATARAEEVARERRQHQARKARSGAFGIGKEELETYKQSAVDIPREAEKAPVFTRDEIVSDCKTSFDSQLPRSSTAPNLTWSMSFGSKTSTDAESTGPDKTSSFEPYSCFHLSRRILPHRVLARHVSGKKTLNIKELLRDVKSPNYSLPDVEQDIVIFGIVASKSEPRAHKRVEAKNGVQAGDRGKYMVMTLADLDHEVDLFLFNTGFARFWKLTEGTVVAILNPGVMPPPPGRQDTGRFSLTINSDADTILEIGMARDLGFCKSVKKDGQVCNAWVNQRRTHYCEYHSNEAIRKQKSTRIEMNSAGFGRQDTRHNRGSRKAGEARKTRGAGNYDWETKSHWFASRSFSAADLLDGKDRTPADAQERKAFLRRSLAAKEKERSMMKKLGRVGNAAGREYMAHGEKQQQRAAAGHASSKGQDAAVPGGHDASDKAQLASLGLGLANNKARQIHLSPVKRKRAESSRTSSSVSSNNNNAKGSGYGWGHNLRDKLSSMRDGGGAGAGGGGDSKRDQGSRSPVRKKTRFVTDKGIREAGRESLGTDLAANDGDDDDLIIVK
ncbi:hypothetical protein CDD82_6456 [Ophiocordyceps australis]|uniref:Uncharacterized protein n=1 Tax=Ophiocordyceps australis TaxID=1399860 RepID=A0A2C5YV71_9HYPO|nr:hypothetical protein CDD82_6456 [Ophiocordyceps australis]